LTLYMNFADGTRYDPQTGELIRLEVRERDYFWTPGFMFFAMIMGLGAGGLVQKSSEGLEKIKFPQNISRLSLSILVIILVLLPVLPIKKGLKSHNNRKGNYLPWDYAYNLLMSCDKDGIVFTNGDNDTFPLWFIQEVEKVRKDVRVVNLSLLNTDWYCLQLKNIMKVPISFTDEEIRRIRPIRTKDGKIFRVQDIMIDNILETNKWKYPVYFATTVSPENKVYKGELLDDHLLMEGMVYRVTRETGKFMVNANKMEELLFKVFKFRGVADTTVHKDENDYRLLANYSTSFLSLADTLRRTGKYEEAIKLAEWNLKLLPWDWRPYTFLVQLYGEQHQLQKVENILQQANKVQEKERLDLLYLTLASYYKRDGNENKALEIVKSLFDRNPSYKPALQFLLSYYYEKKDKNNMIAVLERWVRANPTDQNAVSLLNQISSPEFLTSPPETTKK